MSAPAQEIQVRRRLPRFGQVPDEVLENKAMSLEARAVLGYLVGRSDGFRIAIGRLCYALGIKDARWRRIRKEMEAARYFLQTKVRRGDGTFAWQNVVFDTPFDPATIPPKSTDGGATDGGAIHGKPTDLPQGVNHNETTIRSREARAARARADAQRAPTCSGERVAEKNSPTAPRYLITQQGVHHEVGNELDEANLRLIERHNPPEVAFAVAAAKTQDCRGRAFASAVAKILEPGRGRQKNTPPAWATAGLDLDQVGAAAPAHDHLDADFKEIYHDAT